MRTFGRWLGAQRGRDDAVGEVADRLAGDGSLTAEDYDTIRRTMNERNVEGSAIDALDDAYAEYQRSEDPPKRPPDPLSTH